MSVSFEQVERVAYQARADFEAGLISEDLLVKLYSDYCTNINIKLFVRDALSIFPRGNCGLTSVYLRHQLGEGEATYGSYDGEGHTFWHLGNIVMADITSDQFGGPKVYIGPIIEPWSLES